MSPPTEQTPLPGYTVDPKEMARILPSFLAKYRLNKKKTSVPTACILDGPERRDIFDADYFRSERATYFLFEHPRRLHSATARELKAYLQARQPWEDYDICVFPADLEWCIGLTHNESILLVDRGGYFGQPTPSGTNSTLEYYS